jgi:predicted N-acetyltransferase YhbS
VSDRAASRSGRSEVLRVEPAHIELLTRFIRAVWSPAATEEEVAASRRRAAAANPAFPGEEPPTFLFLLDGQPVGHLTTIPCRLKIGGWTGPAHWMKGLWVLPEHRNGPIGALLVRAAVTAVDVALATAVESAPRRLFSAFGFQDLGALPEHVKILRSRAVLRRLGASQLPLPLRGPLRRLASLVAVPGIRELAAITLETGVGVWRFAHGGVRAASANLAEAVSPQERGDLWRAAEGALEASAVRDVPDHAPSVGSRSFAVRLHGRTLGVARVKRPAAADPRLNGIALATLADALCDPRDHRALDRVIAGAERCAAELGADALLCSASHKQLRHALARRGFLGLAGSVHLLVRPAGGAPSPPPLEQWWCLRADGGADDDL